MNDGDDDHAYDIEWGGFLSNHLVHGQWALDALGEGVAPPAATRVAASRLREAFSRLYKTRLEPLPPSASRAVDIATPEELAALRGRRHDFAPQREFFRREVSRRGIEATIAEHLPSLIRGIAGAAMHPIIHLSIGVLSKQDLVVAEGLAYLNHSYLAAAKNNPDYAESSVDPRPREEVAAEAVDAALARKAPAPLATAGRFQRAMGGLLASAHVVRVLEKEASRTLLKDDMLERNTGSIGGDDVQSFTSLEVLFFHALRTYVGTGSNDYFLLHGVHCAFALQVIFGTYPSLPSSLRKEASEALKLALIATDWIQGCQPMSVRENQCWRMQWEYLVRKEENELNDSDRSFSPERAIQYIQERIQILLRENVAVPRNEHVYKCAAVCRTALARAADSRGRDPRPLADEECRRMVDLCAAVDLCMSRDFHGRGSGEKPTTAVRLAPEHFRMSQLVVEEEKKEDECGDMPTSIVSKIGYTVPPKHTNRRACLDLDRPGACPLRPETVAAQHGSVPLAEGDKADYEECDITETRPIRVWNGRSFSGNDKPTFKTVGFQLIDICQSDILMTEEGLRSAAANHPEVAQKVYSEVSRPICEATGATAAFGYCHAVRVPDVTKSAGSSSSGYAGYAHSDMAPGSWATLLPELVASGKWSSQGPPGVPLAVAERAAAASRYAVVAAWRYLGPADKCRASHLAVLDHRSLREADLLPLSLFANGCRGENYRLSASAGDEAMARHRWYYYPDMTREEALMFAVYDSDHPAKDTTFAETPMPVCIHGAIPDPNPPKDEPPRRSMDIRFLLVWD